MGVFNSFGFSCIYIVFFRNPKRVISAQEGEIVSPADGVVLTVEEVNENRYLHGPALKVSIFLNVFNVHVNRVPGCRRN